MVLRLPRTTTRTALEPPPEDVVMVDSTAAYERGPDGPSFSLLSGDRGRSAAVQGSDRMEDAGPEHLTALLKMGALTL